MRDDFAVLILSHQRANQVDTIPSLRRTGYTGNIYLVVDNEDDQLEKYFSNYGRDKIIVFNKDELIDKIDRGDNFQRKDIVLYARNKIWDIAENLELRYFMMFDDDYREFEYRFNSAGEYEPKVAKNLDAFFEYLIDFYEKSGFTAVALAQGGDFIGGAGNDLAQALTGKRKAMNTFLCSVDRPFRFMGTVNEDVNAYVRLGQLGKIFFTISFASCTQRGTQQSEGGLTDVYLDQGTYIKSFYTILYAPSCVILRDMKTRYRRIHHYVQWRNAVPKILSDEYKKS